MSLKAGIFSRLTSASGVLALVSTRVYPTVAPQECTRPFVVYDVTSDVDPFPTQRGPSGLHSAAVSVRGYADSQSAAAALGSVLQAALVDESGYWAGLLLGRLQANPPDVSFVPDNESYQVEVALSIQYSE